MKPIKRKPKRRSSGLYLHKRGAIWHIGGTIFGKTVRKSTKCADEELAGHVLSNTIAEETEKFRRQTTGVYPVPTFQELADMHLNGPETKSLDDDDLHIRKLSEYIGALPFNAIRRGPGTPLERFITDEAQKGNSRRTVNMALEIINKIGFKAMREWTRPDDPDRNMLDKFIPVKLVTEQSINGIQLPPKRKPYPLSWDEQTRLFRELPDYLYRMAVFAVNTGCRDQEICGLRWDWMREIDGLTVFVVPEEAVKNTNPDNRKDHIVILNKFALHAVNMRRGRHTDYVFQLNGDRIRKMNNHNWQTARLKAGLQQIRVHDLKHTFGARLRFHGVPEDDRAWLLNHRANETISHHYASPSLIRMAQHLDLICRETKLTLLKGIAQC